MNLNSVADRRISPSLPRGFLRHTAIAAAALVAFAGLVLCRETGNPLPLVVQVGIGIVAWMVFAGYVLFYVAAYPIVHAAQRYKGRGQTTWIVWLSVELVGITFGLVRLLYLFLHVIPDIRQTGNYRRLTRACS